MIFKVNARKRIAFFFLALLAGEMLTPALAHALTSGPVQPETKQFAAAGASDMVDLFTGDFKYNIPLLDVEGYPVNLAYASGSNMEDEASWVGLGWNLNVGSVTRNLRGIADDADGDNTYTHAYFKPQITYGGRGTLRAELSGYDIAKLKGSLSVGVFSDNYTGLGAEFGVNSGMSLTIGGTLTGEMGTEAISNTSTGVDKTRKKSLEFRMSADSKLYNIGISSQVSYNSRRGLKERTLGGSMSVGPLELEMANKISYNTPPIYPRASNDIESKDWTFSLDVGGLTFLLFTGGGLTGYKRVRQLAKAEYPRRAYGLMYADNGKDDPHALMDFLREKENPVVNGLPNLPIPVSTPDVFSYTGQAGSGQFRLHNAGSGVLFDPASKSSSDVFTAGGDFGYGYILHGGVTLYNQDVRSHTGKWTVDNGFLAKGDFRKKDDLEAVNEETTYFKESGEQNVADPAFVNRIQGEELVSVKLNQKTATPNLKQGGTIFPIAAPYKKDGRQQRKTSISYLTARELMTCAQRELEDYPFLNTTFTPVACQKFNPEKIGRGSGPRKSGHISEITVQSEGGQRMVYGVPVYNAAQTEYTFATSKETLDPETKQANILWDTDGEIKHNYGRDEYYSREKQPSYATSYLLTSLLSADYSDLTGNGVSEDDHGTAYRFNYSRQDDYYNWRTPFDKGQALFNKGLYADDGDDKGSLVYGSRELWYTQSIESKNMVAYFITEDREDGLDVANANGDMSSTSKLKRLKEIRLYAKNNLATPIKTVVFEYDYSLCPGMPNHLKLNGTGKLTLKHVYFKYGSSTKGMQNKYAFFYNEGVGYERMAADRWGTYKPQNANTQTGWPFQNDEFPYAVQDSVKAALYAGMWNINKIELPTGGSINVEYEADDYAYVQDKRAMQMRHITGMIKEDGSPATELTEARGLRISVPDASAGAEDPTLWFKREYLDNTDVLYTKLFVHIGDKVNNNNERYFDFVPTYSNIEKVTLGGSGDDAYADVWLKSKQAGGLTINPILLSAWQKMKEDYPMYAYPGYDGRLQHETGIEKALAQIVNAFKNMRELKENFYQRANRKKFAKTVDLTKSFARVANYSGHQLGGGVRVKKLLVTDGWNEMTGSDDVINIGQVYEYTTELPGAKDGRTISSGVAAYEPQAGGDENAMHMPVEYMEEIQGGLNNFYYLEKPFGEYLFPSPQVGYSKVTVRRLDETGLLDEKNLTGYDVSEFFTARDYPVIVKADGKPDEFNHQSNSTFSFFGGNAIHEKYMSQGYVVILNDMHGKPRAEKAYNKVGVEVSATEYIYDSEGYNGTSYRLRNRVQTVNDKGIINPEEQVIGREIDMFTHMREEESKNFGTTYAVGSDYFQAIWFPLLIPHFPIKTNKEYRLFRSASLLKTVQYTGVVKKVIKRLDGASVSAENLLYDELTGQPVVTSTQNEFGDPVYSVNIPAYWVYPKMGPAYKTANRVFKDMTTSATGEIMAEYKPFLTAGDEMSDVFTGQRLWVVNDAEAPGGTGKLRLIDEIGKRRLNYKGTTKLIRSGYRNMLGAAAGSITSLRNPIGSDNKLALFYNNDLSGYKVLDAKATLYDEKWGVPGCVAGGCPTGYTMNELTGRCEKVPAVEQSVFNFCDPNGSEYIYNAQGAVFYALNGTISAQKTNAFWGQAAIVSPKPISYGLLGEAMKICNSTYDLTNKWTGVSASVSIPVSGVYHIAMSGNGALRFFVDNRNTPVIDRPASLGNVNHQKIHVYAVELTAGEHQVWAEGKSSTSTPVMMVAYIFGAPLAQLTQALFHTEAQTIWGMTGEMKYGDVNTYIFEDNGTRVAEKYTCDGGILKGPNVLGEKICVATENSCPPNSILVGDDLSVCATPLTGSTDAIFNINRIANASFNANGTSFFDLQGRVVGTTDAGFWKECISITHPTCGRLNKCAFFVGAATESRRTGLTSCFKVPSTGNYYVGYSGTAAAEFFVDEMKVSGDEPGGLTTNKWFVKPLALTAGQHQVRVETRNNSESVGALGMEIYGAADYIQFKAGTTTPTILFSTSELIYSRTNPYVVNSNNSVTSKYAGNGEKVYSDCGSYVYINPVAKNNIINPYLLGYLGNWRPSESKVVETNRTDKNLFSGNTGEGLDIRNSGAYKTFTPFWYLNAGNWAHDVTTPTPTSNELWVTSSYITRYDRQGHELENKDALGRYSSAIYSYKNSLPTAVAANAQRREIFYESFDDYLFNQQCALPQPCSSDDFKFPMNASLITGTAHSGRYGYKIGSGITMTALVHTMEHKPGEYLGVNINGEYYKKYIPAYFKEGFSPRPDRKYIFSAWVKNNNPKAASSKLVLTVNNQDYELNKKAAVEGWVLVEHIMDFSQLTFTDGLLNFGLKGAGGSIDIIVDDVRIFPYDAQVKTYAYDDASMRLMAELDENNYATFYEYDDEGTLIRVKKETEKGILTIKESRSAYRKKP